jgi:hypothetical protein
MWMDAVNACFKVLYLHLTGKAKKDHKNKSVQAKSLQAEIRARHSEFDVRLLPTRAQRSANFVFEWFKLQSRHIVN